MVWESQEAQAGPGTSYQVVRGVVGELPVGQGSSETCLGSSPVNSFTDPTTTIDADYFYLVRAVNACPGGTGTYGYDSIGNQRNSDACP